MYVYLDLLSQPRFLICPYQPSEDSQVSAAYWSDDPWEVELSVVIGLALTKYPKAVFVDIGAGIGSHALYAAAQRRKVSNFLALAYLFFFFISL